MVTMNEQVGKAAQAILLAARGGHDAGLDDWQSHCEEVQQTLQEMFDAAVTEAMRRVRLDKST